MRAYRSWARPIAAGLALVVALAFSASPAAAAPPTPARPIAASTASVVAKLPAPPVLAAQDQGTAPSDSGSFFGSTKGKVAIALFLGAVVYTAVSRNKDAVHSPAR